MNSTFKKILFCTDFSEGAKAAFRYAIRSAGNNNAKLYLLHVLPEAQAQFWKGYIDMEKGNDQSEAPQAAPSCEEMKEYLSLIPDGINYEVIYRIGNAANQITETAQSLGIDLVVIGRPRPHLIRNFLFGNTATKVAKDVPCSLLIVPSAT